MRLHSPYYDVLHLHEFSARFSILPTYRRREARFFVYLKGAKHDV